MGRVLVADTETTGTGPDARIVQLGFVELDDFLCPVVEFESLVDPQCPIEEGAVAVHGITEEMVSEAPTMAELMGLLTSAFGEFSGLNMIAYNSAFDHKLLAPYWGIVEHTCMLRAARRCFPDAPKHKLDFLKEYLGLSEQQSHSALGDVKTTIDLMERVFVILEVSTVTEFIELMREPFLYETMPWGKYKGEAISDVPYSYKKWLLGIPDLDIDMKYSLLKR